MKRSAALLVSLLCAVPAVAQTAAPAADALPPLISDLTIRANDSPLVRAAKTTVRNRTGISPAVRRGVVIDNASVRRSTGTISQSNATLTTPSFPDRTSTTAAPAADPALAAQRAEIQKKVDALKNEQRVRAEEADEPYGFHDDEDRTEMRLNQLPKEIESAQRQLTPPPTPQPPQ
ncbi:MAG TPA: hypothetical protein VGR02_04010 [Thermoanaerobaculia bacterium]|nr:hypothetical protein [Thermoanaerobaculia bacterium]